MLPPCLPKWTLIGFSGHRNLDDPGRAANAIGKTLDDLETTHAPLAAVCSAARGADTLFLEEMARRGLPYFLIFPFDEERFRKDFAPDDWERVAAHFAGALEIEEVRDTQTVNESYLECGMRTVDQCDVLLAVWNSEPAANTGGTGDIVAYARELNKPLIRIDPVTGDVHPERLERLPLRSQSDETSPPPASLRELAVQQYTAFDSTAKRHAPRTRQLVLYIIYLHLAAAALGITGYVFGLHGHIEQAFGGFELAALCVALYLSNHQRRFHHAWMTARASAEVCRSFLACWPLRRRGGQLPMPPIEDQEELTRSLRLAWYLDRAAEQRLEGARDAYLRDRVRDQLNFFEKQYRAAGDRGTRLKRVATIATIAAIAFGAIALAVSLAGYHDWRFEVPKLGAMLLPLVPPALLSLVVAHDLSRRAQRYHDISSKLKEVEARVSAARTWPGLWREVSRCEHLLLYEVAEWHALTRFATDSH